MDNKLTDKNYKKSQTRKNSWLETHIGANRKLLLLNYTKNTGMNFEEYAKRLIDRDVKEHPHLYEKPGDLGEIIRSQNSLEDKIAAIMYFKRKNVSLREITTTLCRLDRSIDRRILRTLVQNTLENQRFFGVKHKRKHCVYGMSEWINKETKI